MRISSISARILAPGRALIGKARVAKEAIATRLSKVKSGHKAMALPLLNPEKESSSSSGAGPLQNVVRLKRAAPPPPSASARRAFYHPDISIARPRPVIGELCSQQGIGGAKPSLYSQELSRIQSEAATDSKQAFAEALAKYKASLPLKLEPFSKR